MKVTDYFDLTRGYGSLKKSVTLIPRIKCFFGYVTSYLSGRDICFLLTVVGKLVDLDVRILQSVPATVPIFVRYFEFGSRPILIVPFTSTLNQVGCLFRCGQAPLLSTLVVKCFGARRRFLDSYFSKVHTVTITNHTRQIEVLAGNVIHYVDAREYPNAHCALDDIEKEVRKAHRHIDHLQNVTDFGARPAGGE